MLMFIVFQDSQNDKRVGDRPNHAQAEEERKKRNQREAGKGASVCLRVCVCVSLSLSVSTKAVDLLKATRMQHEYS
jgi:hypothetical protein